jgi:hypothetical protein
MRENIPIRFWLDCLAGVKKESIVERAQSLTEADWQELDRFSQRHELTPLFYWQLKKSEAVSTVPGPLHKEWQRFYHASAMKNLLRERELRLVLKTLRREGISPILFKGAMLAFFIYPTPACRPMGDLDIWVGKADMPRAQVVLERLGYVQRSSEKRPLTWQIERDGEIQLFGQNTRQGLVELHWGAFHGEWLHTSIDQAWKRAHAQ